MIGINATAYVHQYPAQTLAGQYLGTWPKQCSDEKEKDASEPELAQTSTSHKKGWLSHIFKK